MDCEYVNVFTSNGLIKLVLNTLRKMHKIEFCLNNYTTVLNTNLVSYLKTQGAQVFGTGSTGWNSTKRTAYVTQNLIVPTITGYAPIGVLQWALGSDTDENYKYVSVSKINIMENGKLEVGIVNNSDYDATNLLLYVVFLYVKSL